MPIPNPVGQRQGDKQISEGNDRKKGNGKGEKQIPAG
jgi:hypothetical protein